MTEAPPRLVGASLLGLGHFARVMYFAAGGDLCLCEFSELANIRTEAGWI
jgi:hypothetical protein